MITSTNKYSPFVDRQMAKCQSLSRDKSKPVYQPTILVRNANSSCKFPPTCPYRFSTPETEPSPNCSIHRAKNSTYHASIVRQHLVHIATKGTIRWRISDNGHSFFHSIRRDRETHSERRFLSIRRFQEKLPKRRPKICNPSHRTRLMLTYCISSSMVTRCGI